LSEIATKRRNNSSFQNIKTETLIPILGSSPCFGDDFNVRSLKATASQIGYL